MTDPLNLLPGPVPIDDRVVRTLLVPHDSHRSAAFEGIWRGRGRCSATSRARRAEILLGSGTLANDAIPGQLSLLCARGLILPNGEFGERLVDHAARFELAFDVMDWP
jgi:aspartate aminotransferase-like enzyme